MEREQLLDRFSALEERVAKLEEKLENTQKEIDPAIKFYDPRSLWLNDRDLGCHQNTLQDRLYHHNSLDFSNASAESMSLLQSQLADLDLSTIRQIIFSRFPAADSDTLFRSLLEGTSSLRSLERIDISGSNVSFDTLQRLIRSSWFSAPLIRDRWIICPSEGRELILLEVKGFAGSLEQKNSLTNLLSDPWSVAYRVDHCSPGSAGYLKLLLISSQEEEKRQN